jgi:hypothetical protein
MKTLAVTISGAVSLGAYEAGVMYELLQALQTHNSKHPENQIVIDVLTGASAGGMTAVILAQKLLFQPDSLQDVYNNDLYLPWVKDIDLTGLLDINSDESPEMSILSSDLIEAISEKYLIDPYTTGVNMQTAQRHAAAAKKISLGLAMSNLNGIDYGLDLETGGSMPYTRFQDQVIVDVDSREPGHDSPAFWEPMRNAAVACGAFPFAFRIKDVLRHLSDYQDPKPLKLPNTGMHFAYTDGGVFQNEPIGLAKRLVDEIDEHLNDQRYFIFVAPGMRQSDCNDFSAAPGSSYFNYWNTGKALVNAIFNQARYRDLENVEKINDQVKLFDQQADGLKKLFESKAVNAVNLGPTTAPLLQSLFPGGPGAALNDAGQAARKRLKKQFATEYAAIEANVDVANANAWIDAILLLETVGSLGPQDFMKVYAITEDDGKLAGDDLYAFGGFFDVAYRQHDYDMGRQSVRKFIVWLNDAAEKGLANSDLGPIDYPMDKLPKIDIEKSLDGLKVGAMSQSKRQALRDRLHSRIHDFMEEIGVPWAVREGVDIGFLNGYLNKLLGL